MNAHEISDISPQTFSRFGFRGYRRDAEGHLVPVRECLPAPVRFVAPVAPPAPASTDLALALFHRSLRHQGLDEGLVNAYLALARKQGVGEAVRLVRECRAFAMSAYVEPER